MTLVASSQQTKQVIERSDSILKSLVGERLSGYFSLSQGSYYTFNKRNGSIRTGGILNRKKLPRAFTALNFLYHFNYPAIKGVRGGIWLKLNKNFTLSETVNFDFIPDFLIEDTASNFISADSVLIVAKASFKEKGFEITTPELSYHKQFKKYMYAVYNKLTKFFNTAGGDNGEMEIIEIDAITGKIERIYKGYYRLMIR